MLRQLSSTISVILLPFTGFTHKPSDGCAYLVQAVALNATITDAEKDAFDTDLYSTVLLPSSLGISIG